MAAYFMVQYITVKFLFIITKISYHYTLKLGIRGYSTWPKLFITCYKTCKHGSKSLVKGEDKNSFPVRFLPSLSRTLALQSGSYATVYCKINHFVLKKTSNNFFCQNNWRSSNLEARGYCLIFLT